MTLDELDEVWQVLTERQKIVISKRFGLNDRKPETLDQIGKEFGVGRECIRYHQNVAIRKLRWAGHQLEAHGAIQPSLFPKPKKTVEPVSKSKVKRKKKPQKQPSQPVSEPPLPPPPRYSNTKRLRWLEKWILGSGTAIRRSVYGVTLYDENGNPKMWGKNLRELIDLSIHRKVSPK